MLRGEGKSAEAVVAIEERANEKAIRSEGPKNERAKLNENLRGNFAQPSEAAGQDNCGQDPGPANQSPSGEAAASFREQTSEKSPDAELTTESDARRTDGTSR